MRASCGRSCARARPAARYYKVSGPAAAAACGPRGRRARRDRAPGQVRVRCSAGRRAGLLLRVAGLLIMTGCMRQCVSRHARRPGGAPRAPGRAARRAGQRGRPARRARRGGGAGWGGGARRRGARLRGAPEVVQRVVGHVQQLVRLAQAVPGAVVARVQVHCAPVRLCARARRRPAPPASRSGPGRAGSHAEPVRPSGTQERCAEHARGTSWRARARRRDAAAASRQLAAGRGRRLRVSRQGRGAAVPGSRAGPPRDQRCRAHSAACAARHARCQANEGRPSMRRRLAMRSPCARARPGASSAGGQRAAAALRG